jgi:SAM-dependent methyltransferase
MTCDWENSIYTPEIAPDIMAPANRIPVEDAVFDGILCTDVLEHVAEPLSVLQEFHRLLKPGGLVWITVPFIWYLHEQPYDYFRYTSHGLRSLLERSGFVDIQVTPLSDAFSTVAQLTRDLGWMMGRGGDKCDGQRDLIERTMQQVAGLIGSFSDYDTQWIFPLEYSVEARRRALSFEMGSDIVDSGEGDR